MLFRSERFRGSLFLFLGLFLFGFLLILSTLRLSQQKLLPPYSRRPLTLKLLNRDYILILKIRQFKVVVDLFALNCLRMVAMGLFLDVEVDVDVDVVVGSGDGGVTGADG